MIKMSKKSVADILSEYAEELSIKEVEIPEIEINWYEAMSEEERQKYDSDSNYGCW
jgi:hypothetical protein